MKKNVVIGVLMFMSLMFLVFAYTQKLMADKNAIQALECQIAAQGLQMEAERAAELAKHAELSALKQVELAQEQLQRALENQ